MDDNTFIEVKIISDDDNYEFECKIFNFVNDGYEIKYIDFKVTAKNPNGIWIAVVTKKCIDEDED